MFSGMIGFVVNSCISGCGFPLSLCFKAVIGSVKWQIQMLEIFVSGVCLNCRSV